MVDECNKISQGILWQMVKNIKTTPSLNVVVHDILDVHNLKKNSPNMVDELHYRLGYANLTNNQMVHKLLIKLRAYDIAEGTHEISLQEVKVQKQRKWKEYKLHQHKFRDYEPYEQVQTLDIEELVKFCEDNNITEKMLWQYLLDDTYSKSEEIIEIFYPHILPIPSYMTDLQKFNSHCFLFTQAKTGKSETCYRLYPNENYEQITTASLIGSTDGKVQKTGVLTGQGVLFIDEINKFQSSEHEGGQKLLDFCMTYTEKGIAQRKAWSETIRAYGTKCLIISGNVNTQRPSIKDLYHLISKVVSFSSDSDKVGRRFPIIIYSPELNNVELKSSNESALKIIASFRKEILYDNELQKRIAKLYEEAILGIQRDTQHEEKILSYVDKLKSDALKAFITGSALSSHDKIYFMAVRKVIANNIFQIIKNENMKDFLQQHEQEINDETTYLKKLLVYKQIENLISYTDSGKSTKHIEIEELCNMMGVNIKEDLPNDTRKEIAEKLNTTEDYVRKAISKMRKKEQQQETENKPKERTEPTQTETSQRLLPQS